MANLTLFALLSVSSELPESALPLSNATALFAWWWQGLLPAALQASPLLLLAGLLDLLLPARLHPRWRAALWLVAVAKLLLFSALFGRWFGAGLGPWLEPIRQSLPRPDFAHLLPSLLPPLSSLPVPLTMSASAVGSAAGHPAPTWLLFGPPLLWLTVALALAISGALWLRRQAQLWPAIPKLAPEEQHGAGMDAELLARFANLQSQLGLSGIVLVATRYSRGPALLHLSRPTLFWPIGLHHHLTDAQQEAVLRHEFAHVKRRDAWREWAWFLLCCCFWFHPLLWWAAWRMRTIREHCCDCTAASWPGHEPELYRQALMRVAALQLEATTSTQPLGLPALVDPRAPLRERLDLLAERQASGRAAIGRALFGTAGTLLLLVAWPLATWAETQTDEIAAWVLRPPGSIQLRHLVLQQLAEEAKQKEKSK